MNGKILKVSSNDLYGNADERQVAVFAAFNHKKYMNKYIIFSFVGEYDKKLLYYGSIHLKSDSIVIFSVRDDAVQYIDEFTTAYLNGQIDSNEYEIFDISNARKVELVSYNSKESEDLEKLDQISIKKEKKVEEVEEKKPIFLYFILIILFLLLGGVTFLYFNPDFLTVKNKKLDCNNELYNDEIEMKYIRNYEILFDHKDKLKKMNAIDVYTFKDEKTYTNFKNENKQNTYFNIEQGGYKYFDSELKLKLIYEDKIIIDDYNELYEYLKSEGYSCIEGVYEE